MRRFLSLAFVSVVTTVCYSMQVAAEPANEVILASEVKWELLNPARGDKSPKAGTLWGDRKGGVPTGFLAKFVDGFSSPPHIHNITFRAVVIKGQLKYQVSETEIKTLEPGSYFSSKGKSAHQVSSIVGEESVIYIRTNGKYYVTPD